jgi:folate-binding protein YgfZ
MDSSLPVSTNKHPNWLDRYRAMTAGCGLADVSSRSRVRITGADRVQFLNSFCTNDIKRLQPGEGCEAFLTNHQGKTVGHVLVRVQQGDAIMLDTSPQQATKIIQHFERFVISDRVEFQDQTAATGELLIAGKKARHLLAEVSQGSQPASIYQHALESVQGKDVVVQMVDFAGDDSFFLTTGLEDLAAIQQALVTAGAIPLDAEALDAMRIQAGFPFFGSDITEDNLPQEIGRDPQAISFKKGCYLGQETVARIDALGHVNRMLTRVKFSSGEIPASGTELFANEKSVGKVTSACWSPVFEAPLAFALLRRTHAMPKTRLSSSIGEAEVC